MSRNRVLAHQRSARSRAESTSPRLFLLACVLLLTVTLNNQATEILTDRGPRLAGGGSLLRDIAPADRHSFEISLDSGQLLQLSLDKGDLALELAVYDPAAQKLISQVSHAYETIRIVLPIHKTGLYRVHLSSLERGKSGQYQLEVAPTRTASVTDQRNMVAQEWVAKASYLRAEWTEKSLRESLGNYDKATSIYLSTRSFHGAALTAMSAGQICLILAEYRPALKRYQLAAEYAKKAGARMEEAQALSRSARLYSYLANNDEAQKVVGTAISALEELSAANPPGSLKKAYADALTSRGEVNYGKGNLVKSLADFESALKIFNEIWDRGGEARAHLFIGYISGGIGEPKKAVAEISQALELYESAEHKLGKGLCLTALGLSRSLQRDEERAIELHREARDIFRTIGDRESEAITFNALGQAYEFLSQYPVALENYQQALRLFESSDGLDMAATSLYKIASMYRLLGDTKQALIYCEKSLKLSRAAGKHRTEADALNEVALIYLSQGNREKTIAQYNRILKFYQGISDKRGEAKALNNLGNFLSRLGENQEALDLYERAFPLSEQSGNQEITISTLYNLARAQRDLGRLDDALTSIRRSIKIIEDLRTTVGLPEFRMSYFSGARKNYDLQINILMRLDRERPGQGFDAAGLLASERARARSLVDVLTQTRADDRPGARPELLERQREVLGLLRAEAQYQMELTVDGKDSRETDEVASQINQLRATYQEIEAQLDDQIPRSLDLTQPSTLSLEQIQAELGDDTILLEYALGEEQSYLWAVTRHSLVSYELAGRATLEGAAREVYDLLTARQGIDQERISDYSTRIEEADRVYRDKAQKLSEMLLGQAAKDLGIKRLVFVTEGMLQYLPFDALPLPSRELGEAGAGNGPAPFGDYVPLIVRHEVVSLPSVATLTAIRHEKHELVSGDKIVAVIADPVFSSTDNRVQNRRPDSTATAAVMNEQPNSARPTSFAVPLTRGRLTRLVHASEEADAIVAATPRGAAMVAKNFDANVETATSAGVGKYQIVHFAVHGFFNSEHPELSGIVLSTVQPDGTNINGFMSLQDVYRMRLSAQLVVLSACDTALGKDVKGEGLVSLTRGFMHAGSKSVVTSLWKVDDQATSELMRHFYDSMLREGLAPAAALRSAKEKIRQNKAWSAPYFWAGFVLQGEYGEHIVVRRNSWLQAGFALTATLAVIAAGWIILRRQRRRRIPKNHFA